jgi:hypothetical protein
MHQRDKLYPAVRRRHGVLCKPYGQDKIDFGDFGGEGISGRAKYVGGGASHRGTGTLAILNFSVEYYSDDDFKAIEENIRKALGTEHSGVL